MRSVLAVGEGCGLKNNGLGRCILFFNKLSENVVA